MSRRRAGHAPRMAGSAGLAALARLVREALDGARLSPALTFRPAFAVGGGFMIEVTSHAMSAEALPGPLGGADDLPRDPAPRSERTGDIPVVVPAPTPSGTSDRLVPGEVAASASIGDDHAEIWQIVTAAQAGDGEAFGRLYDRYVETVFRYIYLRVHDRQLAEDFTSETFLRALRRIGGITYQGRDIGAWFVTIARNIVLDHVKSARNRLEVTTGEVLEGDTSAISPETAVLDAMTAKHLMTAVKQLSAEQRECVTLRFIHGLSVSETAAAMGKNDGAIKALQHRAVRKLADLLGDQLK
jgi:RNA polymerase sigma-70 factor (TIGR02952 family)